MITVEHLTKWYGGTRAVEDLCFSIEKHGVYGFLGPNGAGKSTTLNILTGCLSPTQGTVTVCGHDILEEPKKAKGHMGYLPEQPPLYLQESPWDYLCFVAEAKGLRGQTLENQVFTALARTGTRDVCRKAIGSLSKGYRQRVGIAQALLGDPEIIILDEPTVGLDPIQILDIRALIGELGKEHTVIFSSHILSEVQTVCDQVLMIARGRLAAFDTPAHLEAQLRAGQKILLTAKGSPETLEPVATKLPGLLVECAKEDGGFTTLTLTGGRGYETTQALFEVFSQAKTPLAALELTKAGLEDVFLELAEEPENREEQEEEVE